MRACFAGRIIIALRSRLFRFSPGLYNTYMTIDRLAALLTAAQDRATPPQARAEAGDQLAALGWTPEDLHSFVEIPADAPGSPGYAFRIGRYPVTNAQYARFLQPESFTDPALWTGFSQYDFDCEPMGRGWGQSGWNWLEAKKKFRQRWSVEEGILYPLSWQYKPFGIARPAAPVVDLTWYEASAYCRWLLANWAGLAEAAANPGFSPHEARLPLETEWVAAAGGPEPVGRCPWDVDGQVSTDEEVRRSANLRRIVDRTTPVWLYPEGASPLGVWDLGGNVLEWQANFGDEEHDVLALRSGSWIHAEISQRLAPAARSSASPEHNWNTIGFRVCLPGGFET